MLCVCRNVFNIVLRKEELLQDYEEMLIDNKKAI